MGDKVTQQHIADALGVSRVTVSMALRGDKRVNEGTRRKVLRVADELGYCAETNEGARRLALSRYGKRTVNRVVGVVYPHAFLRMNYHLQLYEGLSDTLLGRGYALVTGYQSDDAKCPSHTQMPFNHLLRQGLVDGVIIGGEPVGRLVHSLRAIPGFGDKPIISLMVRNESCPWVSCDIGRGAYLTTRHLLGLGHTHIAIPVRQLKAPYGLVSQEHMDGASQAVLEAGLSPGDHLHAMPFCEYWHLPALALEVHSAPDEVKRGTDSAVSATMRFLADHGGITAIMCLNDAYAINIHNALTAHGYRVPGDYSITGCDDTDPLIGSNGTNLLTSVALPLYRVGQEGAAALADWVEAGITPPFVGRVMPAELVVRHTTGTPRVRSHP